MRPILILFCLILNLELVAQKYIVYSEAGSYGLGARAIYIKEPQTKVTDFNYSFAEIIADKYFIVKEIGDNTVQLLNTDLTVLIPKGKFTDISLSEDNFQFVVVKQLSGGKYGLWDLNQKKLCISCKYNYIGTPNKNGIVSFNTGGKDMMPQLVQGGKWGYMTSTGVEICPAQYTWCSKLNEYNCGTGYVGGNSQDGLYGGFWTIINSEGKQLMDNSKYYLRDKGIYNAPPDEVFILYRKDNGTGNTIASGDGKKFKDLNYEVGKIYKETKLFEIRGLSDENSLLGLMNLNGDIVLPAKYSYIQQFGGQFVLTDPSDLTFAFNAETKTLKGLDVKEVRILDSDEKENTETNANYLKYKSKQWLLYGKAANNKYQFFDVTLNKVLTDVDSGDGYAGGFYVRYALKYQTLFRYYANGKVNYFTINNKSIFDQDFQDVQKKFDEALFYDKYIADSVFVKSNGKWGAVSTINFKGTQFIYDSIEALNKNFSLATLHGKRYLYCEGKRAQGFPYFDKVNESRNNSYYIPRKASYFYPHTHLIIEKNKKRYLVDLSSSTTAYTAFRSCLIDSGNVYNLEGDMYSKNGKPYLIWTQKQLPLNTTACYNLDDWTSKSDINIYKYKVGAVWGIMDENGTIIEKPNRPHTDHVSIWPPEGFDYKVKKK